MSRILSNFLFVCAEIWKNIGVAQRTSIVLLGLVGVAAVATVGYLGTRPNWQVLYSGRDSESAAKLYELVRDENVPVRLRDSGRTILVPFERVNEMRLRATKAGVKVEGKGLGWELFDNTKLGMTELQQQVGYQRALQGELRRMILDLPGVADAKVLLVMPQRRLFRPTDTARCKASILLVLHPGHVLDGSQVAAIRSLVAGTVEGLQPGDVTISDNAGHLLARAAHEGTDALGDTDTYLAYKDKVEASLREKVEAILSPLAGGNRVVAVATVELDFSGGEKTIETFESEKSVVITEKTTTEETSKDGRRAEGVVGAAANLVSVRNPEGKPDAGDHSQESHKTTESQYLIPKTVEKVSVRGPRIRALSVAVTINRLAGAKPRTADELDTYRQLVMSAVGAVNSRTDGRTDTVTVIEQEFVEATPPPADGPPPSYTQRILSELERIPPLTWIRSLVGVLLLIVLYAVFGAAFRREQVERFDLNQGLGNDGTLDVTASYVGEPAKEAVEAKSSPVDMIKSRTESNPALVAGVMSSWVGSSKP